MTSAGTDLSTASAPSRGSAPSVVRRRLLVAAAVAVLPGLLLWWGVAASPGWPQGSDDAIRRAVLAWATGRAGVVEAGAALRWAGGGIVGTAVVVGVTVALLAARRRRDALFVAVCALGGVVIDVVLKRVVDRPRPSDPPSLAVEVTPAFPSGHAMAAVYVCGAIGIVAWRLGGEAAARSWRARAWRTLAVGLWLLGAAVSASRVVLGVHEVSDVVAAWSFAAAWVLVVAAVVLVPGSSTDGRNGEIEHHPRTKRMRAI